MGLRFDPTEHRYTYDGFAVPGVTTILKPLSDLAGIPHGILENARQRGEAVHLATEYDDMGILDESSVTDEVMGYVVGYRKFKTDHNPEVVVNELPVYHKKLRYAGTLDRIFIIDDVRTLVDLKATYETPIYVGPQVAAYMEAFNYGRPDNQKVKARASLRLKADGTYDYQVHNCKQDWQVFQSCLLINNWLKTKGA